MKDAIINLLEDGEELLGYTQTLVFVLIKRKHDQTPFIIKGYDPKRNEFFDKFFCCDNLEAAKQQLQGVYQAGMMRLQHS